MINGSSAHFRQKTETPVTIRMLDGKAFNAVVFVVNGHRLSDLLNDDRAFIPARRDNGEVVILAKSQITSIIDARSAEHEQTDAEENEGKQTGKPQSKKFDPYTVLKLSPTASTDEIRAVYKARIKTVHPDSIAALNLDEELADAALKATQKLNFAYRMIIREREKASGEEAAA